MKRQSHSGFTLLELIAALAIAGILLGIGVPSFVGAIKNSRQSTNYQALVSALYLARSEAVKRTSMVSVCARATDTSCGSSWQNGWLIFTDNAGVGLFEGQVDAADVVLGIGGEISSNNTLSVIGLQNGFASAAAQKFIRYTPAGSTNWQGGTFTICDDRGADHAVAMNIVLTGDIRKARSNGSDPTPIDVNGDPVSCP